MKKNEIMWIFLICCIVGIVSCIITTKVYEKKIQALSSAEIQKQEDSVTVITETARITPSTKMVYEYYYTGDGVTQTLEDVPPYFLLDMTLEDMKKVYTDWKIISFSAEEVVMRKTLEAKSNEQYIIGEKNGYIAVYYKEAQHGIILHEITNTPLSALPLEEQERLLEGISVIGDENLSKILSDYTS
ncbi:hypothetical protein [Clostridium sp. MD294]|uniref:hypothetical protein n=1 Tax=Clostridium sp. MD294 TaxID=97138 RepID=UPI0002CC2D6F|nr:hypothetical protein [Clostridium sp. MD294]NDO45692.1 hypothetical protein [Clostridium sp. MD294]USF30655.1 hypothetical protein C820_002098 [Clostridium sp. MD294]